MLDQMGPEGKEDESLSSSEEEDLLDFNAKLEKKADVDKSEQIIAKKNPETAPKSILKNSQGRKPDKNEVEADFEYV